MDVYLAGPWVHRRSAVDAAALIIAAGHTITWPWWEHEGKGWAASPKDLAFQARKDVTAIREADVVILLNSAKSEGKAVEQGLAIAWEKPIIAVGQLGDKITLNVFHYLALYHWVPTIEDAIAHLKELS